MKINIVLPNNSVAESEAIAFCDTCGEEIYDGELYGQRDGLVLCFECANNKWYGLSAAEKFEFLGYDVEGLGGTGTYECLRD